MNDVLGRAPSLPRVRSPGGRAVGGVSPGPTPGAGRYLGLWSGRGRGCGRSPFSRLQPAQAAAAAAGEPRPREAMKVKKGGGGAGTGAEHAPGASGPNVEPKPELQAESESGSESEPEAGPGPRPGPLQRKQPIGPEDVLGLQRITGGEHPRGSIARGRERAREGALRARRARAPAPFPALPRLPSPTRVPLSCVLYPSASKPEISMSPLSSISLCARLVPLESRFHPFPSFLRSPSPFPMVEVGQQLQL